MRRALHPTTRFLREAKRLAKKDQKLVIALGEVLEQLEEDAFHPSLKTHRLKGKLDGLWSSSAGYDQRVVFRIAERDGEEVILLQTLGSHDEVY